jgi:hypothetical protein
MDLSNLIENAINLIHQQNQRLDMANAKLGDKDKQLFNRVVDSYTKHDRQEGHDVTPTSWQKSGSSRSASSGSSSPWRAYP